MRLIMSKTENRNRIIKRIIFFMAIAAFVFLMWKVCVSSAITPMEQVTKNGWFEVKDSPIRGIRIYADSLKRDRSIGEVPEFSVRIDDSDGNTVWEKTYYNTYIEPNECLILEEFERGEGIEVINGSYRIHNTLSEDETIRVRHKIMAYDGSYGKSYLICSAVALLFMAGILAVTMIKDSRRQLAVNYFVILVLMGILFSVIMPPLAVPDEESHFIMAYDMADKILSTNNRDEYGNRIMRETDVDSITYLHNAASIGRWYATFGEPADAEEMTVITKRTGVPTTTPLYAYVLPSMGVTLARLCKMNGHWLLLMGRLFNLCGTAAIMAFALFLLPGAKKYFCVLGLLPEVIYILASYSYDALNLALCFLSVAYFFYMIDEGKKVTIRNILIFVGIVFLMIPIKLVYAPLLGLLLLIPGEQLSVNKKMIIAAGALGACAVGALLVSRWRDIVVLLRGINYNEDGNAVSLAYILENPRSVLLVLLNDIEFNFDYYIKSMLGEFVGRDRFEGKFEFDLVYLPLWMNMLLGLLLGFGINRERKAENKPWKRVWLVFLALCSCLLIFLSMYLSQNTVDELTIHGVQGRYFLPVLMLLPFCFGRYGGESNEEKSFDGKNGYLIIMAGVDIMAIFIQFMHLALDYYAR